MAHRPVALVTAAAAALIALALVAAPASRADVSVPTPGGPTEAPAGKTTDSHDFRHVPQLYCNGTCSYAGVTDCDQADADVFCKLLTGDPRSVATSFKVRTALPLRGFACPGDANTGTNSQYGKNLGPMPERGVNRDVHYQTTSILANHGAGNVIVEPRCTLAEPPGSATGGAMATARKTATKTKPTAKPKKLDTTSAAVLWFFEGRHETFGLFVDDELCWLGDEKGNVYALDHDARLKRQLKLPSSVKSLVGDGQWLYAAAEGGFDVSGATPRLSYTVKSGTDVLWMDISSGTLFTSDRSGTVAVLITRARSCGARRAPATPPG